MGERVADHFGLLVDFLGHEVLVVALVHQLRGSRGLEHRPLDFAALLVMNLDTLVRQHRPVAVFQITDGVGKRRQRNRIGSEIHFPIAVTNGQRRAFARADHQVVLAGKHEGERESTAQLLERGGDRLGRLLALLHLIGDEMGDDLGVGFAANFEPLLESRSRNSRKFSMMPLCATATRSVACGCALLSVGLPCVAQRVWPMPILPASGSFARRFQLRQLALGAAPAQRAVIQRGDAGGIVAPVFEAFERLDQMAGNRLASSNADDPAHR